MEGPSFAFSWPFFGFQNLLSDFFLQGQGQSDSSGVPRNPPVYPADVAQVLEDATCTALIAFVCLCSGCPENKESVSPDMLELLSEKLLPIQV